MPLLVADVQLYVLKTLTAGKRANLKRISKLLLDVSQWLTANHADDYLVVDCGLGSIMKACTGVDCFQSHPFGASLLRCRAQSTPTATLSLDTLVRATPAM